MHTSCYLLPQVSTYQEDKGSEYVKVKGVGLKVCQEDKVLRYLKVTEFSIFEGHEDRDFKNI